METKKKTKTHKEAGNKTDQERLDRIFMEIKQRYSHHPYLCLDDALDKIEEVLNLVK